LQRYIYLRTYSRVENNIHDFVGPPRGLKKIEAPHINKDSSPLALLTLIYRYFSVADGSDSLILSMVLRQTSQNQRSSPDITLLDLMTFLAVAL
jgi:hypothetical protein